MNAYVYAVMEGFVPAIHVFFFYRLETWMPGTRPGMTNTRAFPLLMESEAELHVFDSTRFLYANRSPLRLKTLQGSLAPKTYENAEMPVMARPRISA